MRTRRRHHLVKRLQPAAGLGYPRPGCAGFGCFRFQPFLEQGQMGSLVQPLFRSVDCQPRPFQRRFSYCVFSTASTVWPVHAGSPHHGSSVPTSNSILTNTKPLLSSTTIANGVLGSRAPKLIGEGD
ncbi:hypothetical protein DPX39_110057700 [Trypanosoma brucei equiperdum]|uniref:Uncharacterized protein n=1 Tax=Trypanosoma brucei equiperdum TaxID=630700 RepID=A0A3L6KVY8_9TRYP|nr:hypothetical protein DPX39_110057700 [Trypanosoma brucei equiperdum]